MITHRVLPPEEWEKVAALPPFDQSGLPNAEHWRIVVAEADGAIVGFCCLFDAVHWEPWYVAPDARGNPAVIRGLIQEGAAMLRGAQADGAFAMIETTQTGATRAMIERFGFKAAPGDLYFAEVEKVIGG